MVEDNIIFDNIFWVWKSLRRGVWCFTVVSSIPIWGIDIHFLALVRRESAALTHYVGNGAFPLPILLCISCAWNILIFSNIVYIIKKIYYTYICKIYCFKTNISPVVKQHNIHRLLNYIMSPRAFVGVLQHNSCNWRHRIRARFR